MNGEDRTEISALRAEVRQLAAEQRALGAEIRVLSVKFEGINEGARDREMRIRGLEKWKNALPVATLTFLGTTSVALVALFFRT
jgi:hypothetical protein